MPGQLVGGWFESFGYHPLWISELEIKLDNKGILQEISATRILSATNKANPKLIADTVTAKCD